MYNTSISNRILMNLTRYLMSFLLKNLLNNSSISNFFINSIDDAVKECQNQRSKKGHKRWLKCASRERIP